MCEGGHALLLERLKSDPRAWSVRMQPITNLIANFACNKFRLRSQIEFGNDCQCDRRQTRKRVDTRLIESSRSRRGKLLGHFFEVAYRLHPHWCHLGRDLASGSWRMKLVSVLAFNYSLTTSICLSITCPVNRSIEE